MIDNYDHPFDVRLSDLSVVTPLDPWLATPSCNSPLPIEGALPGIIDSGQELS